MKRSDDDIDSGLYRQTSWNKKRGSSEEGSPNKFQRAGAFPVDGQGKLPGGYDDQFEQFDEANFDYRFDTVFTELSVTYSFSFARLVSRSLGDRCMPWCIS